MQIFELHFNPKLKEGAVFDSFIYEPENIYEKKLGSLYVVGELQNALPTDKNFLDNLSKILKEKYYTLSLKAPEKALSESLKKANDFLYEEVKKENVSWLGNLNLAILSLKDFNLVFTKTGTVKILLIRGDQIIDIGKNLEPGEIEPYPLKVFFNVVSGQIVDDDKILVLTQDVYQLFQREKIIEKIAKTEVLEEKNLRQILPSQLFEEESSLKTSGICFLAIVREPIAGQKSQEIQIKRSRHFSLSKKLSLAWKNLKEIFSLPKLNKKAKSAKRKATNRLNKKLEGAKSLLVKRFLRFKKTLKIPEPKWLKNLIKNSQDRKKLILVAGIVLVLALGFLIFRGQEIKNEDTAKESYSRIEKDVFQAESFLILKNNDKASSLLKQAWKDILPLTEKQSSIKQSALSLKSSIEKRLNELNFTEKIDNPEILFDLRQQDTGFLPERMLFLDDVFYFYSLNTTKFYSYDLDKETGDIFPPPQNIKAGCLFLELPVFLSDQDKILFFNNKTWQEKSIPMPAFSVNFTSIASYEENLYLLDQDKYEIIKYGQFGDGELTFPFFWLKDKSPKQVKPKSLAVDGTIWLLNENSEIDSYWKGSYIETIGLDIFPFVENIQQMKTKPGLPYFYLLEPAQKRLIITGQTGNIIKQFQSERFDNLKDFDTSEDGKTIYLLNGPLVYKISF